MVRFKTIAAAAVVAALAAGSAVAQGPRGGGREGRGGPSARLGAGGPLGGVPLASLNLTQAQQDQIQAIRERNRQEMEVLQERMRTEILAALTPEQQAQVKELQAERPQAGRSERRERRRSQQQ